MCISGELLLYGSFIGVAVMTIAVVVVAVCVRYVKKRKKDADLPVYSTLVADSVDDENEQINL